MSLARHEFASYCAPPRAFEAFVWSRTMKSAPVAHPLWACLWLLPIASASVSAQHVQEHSPYAHTHSAEIPSLTEEEVRALRDGEGMGLARADGWRWPCGERAARALAGRIGGRSVVCEKSDRYGRVVALCRAGGEDLNAWMPATGARASDPGRSPPARVVRHAACDPRSGRCVRGALLPRPRDAAAGTRHPRQSRNRRCSVRSCPA